MAAPGRRTSQPSRPEGERPRFRDTLPDDVKHPEANPYLAEHRQWKPEILPASEAWPYRGRWAEAFGREAPLHVEIGPGNGFFLTEMATRHPEWNIVAVEIRFKRTVLCAKKIRQAGCTNVRIIRYDAWFLDDLFEDASVAGLYVNHPDPWPKARHEKNRLVSRWFLEEACRVLQDEGRLRVKSDFRPNVERIPELLDAGPEGEPLPRLPLEITGQSADVIRGEAPWPDDIETNYQSKMRKAGKPVYALEAVRLPR